MSSTSLPTRNWQLGPTGENLSDNYEVVFEIGHGNFGKVFLVRQLSKSDQHEAGQLLAFKQIRLDRTLSTSGDLSARAELEAKEKRAKVEREGRIHVQLNHPNIVRCYNCYFGAKPESYCILQEFCDDGCLKDKIVKAAQADRILGPFAVADWFQQLAAGLHYLHEQHILHRDLNPRNVFLTKTNLVKIGDYGIATQLESTMAFAETFCGTPSYLSPEMCTDDRYTNKCDVWALGVILYEMVTLQLPFRSENLMALSNLIRKSSPAAMPDHVRISYSDDFRHLIFRLLVKKPSFRPSARDVLKLAVELLRKTENAGASSPVGAETSLASTVSSSVDEVAYSDSFEEEEDDDDDDDGNDDNNGEANEVSDSESAAPGEVTLRRSGRFTKMKTLIPDDDEDLLPLDRPATADQSFCLTMVSPLSTLSPEMRLKMTSSGRPQSAAAAGDGRLASPEPQEVDEELAVRFNWSSLKKLFDES